MPSETVADDQLHPLVRYGYCSEKEHAVLNELGRRDHKGLLRDPEGYVEAATALCRDNLPLFTTLFLNYELVPYAPYVWNRVRVRNRNLIELPRSHAKSQYFALGRSIQRICYAAIAEAPDPRILLLQETAGQAIKSVNAIRGAIDRTVKPDSLMGAAFGNLKERITKVGDGLMWLNLSDGVSKDPTLEGVGAGGAITGGHPTDLIGDDIVSRVNSKTEYLRQQMWDWWNTTPNGMIDPGTWVGLLYTPKYPDDLHARLRGTKKYKRLRIPALNRVPEDPRDSDDPDFTPIYELDENGEVLVDDDGDEVRVWVELTERGRKGRPDQGIPPLVPLWPCPHGTCIDFTCADGGVSLGEETRTPSVRGTPLHRSPEYLIHDKWFDDRIAFFSEFMLEFISSDEAPIKQHMIRCYSHNQDDWGKKDPYSGHEIVPFPKPDDINLSVHAWDHAISTKARADETAVAQLYRTKGNNVYIGCSSGRWEPSEVIEMMEDRFRTDPWRRPSVVVTEAINFERTFGQRLQDEATTIVPVHMVKHAKDKLSEIVDTGYLNHLMQGKVYFDIEDEKTVLQHLQFTGGKQSAHDDRVDACRLAFSVIAKKPEKRARTYRTRGRGPLLSRY